jgi:hypothetical protein
MRKMRISKRHHPAKGRLDPLPLDLRDPDITRAKQLARPLPPGQHRHARAAHSLISLHMASNHGSKRQ